MFKPIKSFEVDHTTLVPGVYERDNKLGVISWDIRLKTPNSGDYMTPEISHTLEHFLAMHLKNVLGPKVISVCPMGCLTGFYVISFDTLSRDSLILGLAGANIYIGTSDHVPGAYMHSCGNYLLQDLEGAQRTFKEFYESVLLSKENVLTMY